MSTLCIVGHPDSDGSSSQQYLLQAGKQIASVNYLNLAKNDRAFDIQYIKRCLAEASQVIFQFPLYWYQAPSILKEWIDQIWSQCSINELKEKYLGIVVIVGSKKEHYQAGGKVGRTLSELLSSYEVLAKYFKMHFKPIFPIYQFQFMTEYEKGQMMWHYLYYLENTQEETFSNFQQYLITKAQALDANSLLMNEEQAVRWDLFLEQLQNQADEVDEIMNLMRNEE